MKITDYQFDEIDLIGKEDLMLNICPRCHRSFTEEIHDYEGVIHHGCGFKIVDKRYKNMLAKQQNIADNKDNI